MQKAIFSIFLLLITSLGFTQVIGHVDKKTKEFFIPSDLKTEYRIFGYLTPDIASKKMICFSSRIADVKANYNGCPLGSYFDTGKLRIGDRISYLGNYGSFARMVFISGNGKRTIFYLLKSNFVLR